jgi:serine/threonine protein kinase
MNVASLAPGELVLQRYLIGKLLGRGGMGEVYEAYDQFLKETVALKTLRADRAGGDDDIRRFQREIQIARKVTHPNVCRVFEVGVHEPASGPSVRFFTMELLNGESLSARIRRKGKLSPAEAFPLAAQMADGLQAAHAAGIVHTDFKSANVILVPGRHGERAVITDFGLARSAPPQLPDGETVTMSGAGHIAGTVAYMSPEQLSGGVITPASDIYSFGVVLFEMAAGTLPFDERHVIQSAMQRASGEVDIRTLCPDIDPRWESAISRCLQRQPANRFASAEDLAAWFRPHQGWSAFRYWTRRDWIRSGAATAGVLAIGGGAWYASSRPYQPKPAALEWYRKALPPLQSMSYDTARKFLEQAVAADPKFALAHASLARVYEELDYSDQAKETMLHALTVAQETRLSRADEKGLRALEALVSRDYDRAQTLFNELESTAPPAGKASAALESGWIAEKRDDTAAAIAAYQRAVALDPSYSAAKLRLGFMLGRRAAKDDLLAALNAFAEAERLYSASSDYEGVTETLYQRASLLNRRSRAPEALPVIDKALGIARTVGSRYQEIRLRLLLGTATRNTGDAARAAALAQQAIDQAVDENMDNLATSGLGDLGNAYFREHDLKAAEPLFRRALDLSRRSKVRRQEARAQASLGSVCEQDDRPEEGKPYADAALTFYRQAGFRREFIQAATVSGGILDQLADYDAGVRILSEAVQSAVILQDSGIEVQARSRLADNLQGSGDWPKALEQHQLAARLLGGTAGSAYQLWNAANLLWLLGRAPEAAGPMAEARRLLKSAPNSDVLFGLALLEAKIAYSADRLNDASAAARDLPVPPGRAASAAEADLFRSLLTIRSGKSSQGWASAQQAIQRFDQTKAYGAAAAARLSAAEALLAARQPSPAGPLAEEAIAFAEPRHIWESIFRGHLIAAQAQPDRAGPHNSAAGNALAQMRMSWTSAGVDRYLQRPEIRRLAAAVQP